MSPTQNDDGKFRDDERVLRGLAALDKMQRHLMLMRPPASS
jgi:hypothetical protein